jgi:tRNA(Ile)-lysidine synthase
MSFSAVSLRAVLEANMPIAATGLVVAISGGADSACLLTALVQPGGARFRNLPVRAVHVDHGLQPAGADFRRGCEALCRRLKVPLTIVAVTVASTRGVSIEAAARDARYAGLARQLAAGECLLTAHHAEDQAETVLLQLLRGAGLKGMSAMPICRAWHGGWHLRPLLCVAQRDLREFGAAAGVTAVSDPMNLDLRFDRTYLRRRLWPLIEERWPGAAIALSRTARHFANAQDLLDQSAAAALLQLRDGTTLSVPGLRALSPPERVNVLRYWISANDLQPPPSARLAEALRQFMAAGADHLPVVMWDGHALRRYRDRLFLTPAHPPRVGEPHEWSRAAGARLYLGRDLGTLQWSPRIGGLDPDRLPDKLVVRRRQGGETLRPRRRARTQSLQHLCQSSGVLPWMRDALPLMFAGDDLIAVGDLWQDARWCVAEEALGLGCDWEDAPVLL